MTFAAEDFPVRQMPQSSPPQIPRLFVRAETSGGDGRAAGPVLRIVAADFAP